MPAQLKQTKCGNYTEQELFALGSYFVPTGHHLRSRLLQHFSKGVIKHPNPRFTRALKTPEYEIVLPMVQEICGNVLNEDLEADESKFKIHTDLVLLACTAKGFINLLPIFQRTRHAKQYVEGFIEKCDEMLVLRRLAGLTIPDVPETTAAGEPLYKAGPSVPNAAAHPEPEDVMLTAVGQRQVLDWEDLPVEVLASASKLGEGVFGEVYRTKFCGQPIALKIIPVRSARGFDGKINGEELKDPASIVNELKITRELGNLAKGETHRTDRFISLQAAWVVNGLYPAELLRAWDEFAQHKGTYNDRPNEYAVQGQRFLCIGLSLGGHELEGYEVADERQATSILVQSMLALTVAEKELKFEHRDLHAGNVLIQQTDEATVSYRLDGKDTSVKTFGVKVCIIDFSLSRMEHGSSKYFFDAATDPSLFTASSEDYQFQIYRMMQANNKNNWADFSPKSNLFWCHYLSRVLTGATYTKRTSNKRKEALQLVFDRVLQYDTIEQFVQGDRDFRKLLKQQQQFV